MVLICFRARIGRFSGDAAHASRMARGESMGLGNDAAPIQLPVDPVPHARVADYGQEKQFMPTGQLQISVRS